METIPINLSNMCPLTARTLLSGYFVILFHLFLNHYKKSPKLEGCLSVLYKKKCMTIPKEAKSNLQYLAVNNILKLHLTAVFLKNAF